MYVDVLPAYKCLHNECVWCPRKPEEGIRFTGTGVVVECVGAGNLT